MPDERLDIPKTGGVPGEIDYAIMTGGQGDDFEEPLYFDTETGEVLDAPPGALNADVLPFMARVSRSCQRQVEQIDEYEKAEIKRIKDACQMRRQAPIDKLNQTLAQVRGILTTILPRKKGTGEYAKKSWPLPGLGTFALRSSRAKVDTAVFDALPDDEKKLAADNFASYFVLQPKPVKKIILADLNADKPMPILVDGKTLEGIPVFSLTEPEEYATFKQEAAPAPAAAQE